MNAKIIVATHKLYDMPTDDIYLPVHVGREGKAPAFLGLVPCAGVAGVL